MKFKQTTKTLIIETLILSVLLTALSLGVINIFQQNEVPLIAVNLPAVSPSPSPLAVTSPTVPVTIASGITPDGTATLSLKEQRGKSTTTYTLFTTTAADPTEKLLFTTTLESGQTLSVPFNTWSPDKKYVFIKADIPPHPAYYVFKATEKAADKPVNILDLFSQRYSEYTVTDMTGWAGPGLLILNTDKNTGGVGPSFWFDVASQTFIQLSTRFN